MKQQEIQKKHYNKTAREYVERRSNRNTLAYRDELWKEFINLARYEFGAEKQAL